jgi:hypothetical protein
MSRTPPVRVEWTVKQEGLPDEHYTGRIQHGLLILDKNDSSYLAAEIHEWHLRAIGTVTEAQRRILKEGGFVVFFG